MYGGGGPAVSDLELDSQTFYGDHKASDLTLKPVIQPIPTYFLFTNHITGGFERTDHPVECGNITTIPQPQTTLSVHGYHHTQNIANFSPLVCSRDSDLTRFPKIAMSGTVLDQQKISFCVQNVKMALLKNEHFFLGMGHAG
jgi:hypothetical protein